MIHSRRDALLLGLTSTLGGFDAYGPPALLPLIARRVQPPSPRPMASKASAAPSPAMAAISPGPFGDRPDRIS